MQSMLAASNNQMKNSPNQALEPTSTAVHASCETQEIAPAALVAHLERWAKRNMLISLVILVAVGMVASLLAYDDRP